MPIDGWTRREPSECAEYYDNESPVIAEWSDGDATVTVALFEDGLIEAAGTFPVDILPHIQAEWLNWQKSKGIAG